jgi:prophage regulatory protein
MSEKVPIKARHEARAGANRVLRDHEVEARVGLSRSTRWRLVRAGQFPAPIELGERARGWIESDIDEWIASRTPAAFAGSTIK